MRMTSALARARARRSRSVNDQRSVMPGLSIVTRSMVHVEAALDHPVVDDLEVARHAPR